VTRLQKSRAWSTASPSLFDGPRKRLYKGAHQATLDPLAARRPAGGLFMWSEQLRGSGKLVSGNPHFRNSSAAALLSYDVPHTIPWDWRVSLYTWTKGISAGAYLLALLLVVFGLLRIDSPVWLWVAPTVSGVFLALTGGLLIWDLEHPLRFYMIFTRPQWKSWLVRGAFIIAGYSIVLGLHLGASLLGIQSVQRVLLGPGLLLSVMVAVYTAYLFAQAKARDMWQNALLVPHLALQALLLGAAALLPFALWLETTLVSPLLWILGATSVLHLLMVWGEVSLAHPTAHARLAVWEMVHNRYRAFFWAGVALTLAGALGPLLGPIVAPSALVGLLLYEHAYVQAGQSVPLA
jgi:formate-dependent nitrite reductase membrane component NrfD